ncbi:hypothetical protein [Halosolutus halophilus]|uniref:hypothetical protein n=1 Tax=Halosolutus halophilus TaxID=1552990 RepID=UPI002235030B|nr:hypothetical protein [Halosolutus halophilus]
MSDRTDRLLAVLVVLVALLVLSAPNLTGNDLGLIIPNLIAIFALLYGLIALVRTS